MSEEIATYLGPKGYTIKKEFIELDELNLLKKELTVSAYVPKSSIAKPTPFPIYRETKNKIYKENTCRRPTAENPFMNVVFSDYLDLENVPQACNTSDENIQKEMNNLYNSSIFRNTSDVFARNNSQNMFYTVPTNLGVQGQTDFRNWLYKTNQTCKENTANCTYPDRLYGESQRY